METRVYNETTDKGVVHRSRACNSCFFRFETVELQADFFAKMKAMTWVGSHVMGLPGVEQWENPRGEESEQIKEAPLPVDVMGLEDWSDKPKKKPKKKRGALERYCDYCGKKLNGLNADTDDSDRSCPLYFCNPDEEHGDPGCRVKWESEEGG